jgi:microcystin-dependent protein
MKKIILSLFVFVSAIAFANAQTCVPDTLCITGVARYTNNQPVADTTIDVQIEVSQGFPLGNGSNIMYCELLLNITTNQFGEFTACFGAPTFLCQPFDPFAQVTWENCDLHYRMGWRITGSSTISPIVTSKFGTVPYAFASRTAEKLVGSQGAVTGDVLKWNGTSWVPGTDLGGGGSSNSFIDGATIDFTVNGSNVTAETNLQLQVSGNTLSLVTSGGSNSVSLPGGGSSYTAGSGISINGSNVISATDASATNEIQTLSLSGQTLSLSNGGGSVTLPSSGVPVGTIIAFAGDVNTPGVLPSGYLVCDGSPIVRSQFPNLFSAIGIAWGQGDGVNTFNLPDLRGMFMRGVSGGTNNDPDKNLRTPFNPGGNSGNNVGSLQSEEFKSHNHTQNPHNHIITDPGHSHLVGSSNNPGGSNTAYEGGGGFLGNRVGTTLVGTGITINNHTATNNPAGGAETRPINVYVYYIIKY